MAKLPQFIYRANGKKKRPGKHSKNASLGQKGYKKPRRGQGKRR